MRYAAPLAANALRPYRAPAASTARTVSRSSAYAPVASRPPPASPPPPWQYRRSRCGGPKMPRTATSLAALRIGRRQPAAAQASLSQGKARETGRDPGASKVSLPSAARSSRFEGAVDPVRPGQGMGDRRAHVRRRQMGQHGAVRVGDQAMHRRLRMDDHVQLLGRQREQEMRLDHLQALVHQGGAVDRNLGAHRPVGMGHGLLGRRTLHGLRGPFAERSARGGEGHLVDGMASARSPAPGRRHCARNRPGSPWRAISRACGGTGRPPPPRIPCWPAPASRRAATAFSAGRSAGRADDGDHHDLGRHLGGLDHGLRARGGLDAGAREQRLQFAQAVRARPITARRGRYGAPARPASRHSTGRSAPRAAWLGAIDCAGMGDDAQRRNADGAGASPARSACVDRLLER